MKRNLILFAGLCFIAIALISGCTTTTISPVSTGKMEGTVQLEEMDCSPSSSSAGVKVEILGTGINTVSDTNGKYMLEGAPAGYWTIHFSKSGFCEYYSYPIEFVGSGTLRLNNNISPILARIPNWQTTLGIPIFAKGYDPTQNDTGWSFGFSASTSHEFDSVGKDHFSVYGDGLFSFVSKQADAIQTYFAYNNGSSGHPSWPSMSTPAVHTGDTVYMVVYPASCGGGGQVSYYEGDSVKTKLTGLGPPSNEIHFVLP